MNDLARYRAFAPLTAVALLAGVVACTSEPSSDSADTSDVSASMLEARTDPGLGTGSSVPIGGGSAASSSRDTSAPGQSGGSPPGQSAGSPVALSSLGYDSGSPDAPVQIVEFSDFGCGYCARFHNEVFPTLEREYIETGKVEWKYVPMVLGMFGPNAEIAARAGECAGEQDRFADMRDVLFARQRDWKGAQDPGEIFRGWAAEQDLDVERWTRCVEEGWRDQRIVAGTQVSRQAGVRGTPTFYILGYAPIPGMLPLELFREVLDTVIAKRARGEG